MQIYAIRHSQTNWNQKGKLQGQVNIALNKTGIQMAQTAHDRFKNIAFETAYVSPLVRAIQTAKFILGDNKVSIQKCPELLEVSYGDAESSSVWAAKHLPWHPMYSFFNDIEHYNPPYGAETIEHVQKRCRHFLETLKKEESCGIHTALLVSHGSLLRILQAELLGISVKEAWRIPEYDNCSGFIIELKDGIFHKAEFEPNIIKNTDQM